MRPTTTTRVNAVWLFLSVITVVAWLLASLRGHREFSPSSAVTVIVTIIAAVKVRLIISEFMETRIGPIWLRRLTDGWLVALVGAVLALYLA